MAVSELATTPQLNRNPPRKPRPLRFTLVLVVICSALFLPLSFITFSYSKRTFIPLEARPFSGTATCILYDRPPRTGSTTISMNLRSCVKSKGYALARSYGGSQMEYGIRYMLNSSSDKLAAVSSHVCISREDIERLKKRCGTLLYISSTSPMKKRMFSELKYRMQSHNGNSTITEDHLNRIRLIVKRGTEQMEASKEKYPYCSSPVAKKPPFALKPDYVIRAEYMDDFQTLLEALGCPGYFKSSNVHTASFDKAKQEEILNSITLRQNDRTHKELTMLAETNNDQGLEKALLF